VNSWKRIGKIGRCCAMRVRGRVSALLCNAIRQNHRKKQDFSKMHLKKPDIFFLCKLCETFASSAFCFFGCRLPALIPQKAHARQL